VSNALSIGFVSVSDIPGGAEAHTVSIGQGMRARGHDAVLYGRCPGWAEAGLRREAVRLGPKWSRRTMPLGVLRVPAERRRATAIPTHSLYYLQFKREQIALTGPLSRKAPVVWIEHGRWKNGAMGRVLLGAYGRAARHVARVLCDSDAVAQDLRAVVDPAKLVVAPNAVDIEKFSPATKATREAMRERLLPERLRDRRVGVVASRLHPDKRLERAVAAALAAGTGLLVLGDGPARDALEKSAGGHPDVVFLGRKDNVPDYFAAADYFVYCGSPTEGMPTVILEAAASGLPIIGFDGDPSLEFIDRCGGAVLADPGDLTGEIITDLIDQPRDGVNYIRKHHSREGLLDAYERVFLECSQ
jgi:glycosyltransferase involved in cell wall biosynthesis